MLYLYYNIKLTKLERWGTSNASNVGR